jgi:L-iditol 2-dehydrogenase
MECHFCRHHAFAQCAQYKRTGITAGFEPAGGGFAEYVRVMPFVLPGVVKIPPKNTFEEGAMLEPVNTVLKAIKRLALLPGDNVLVAGQGPIGLMFTKLLQLHGINVLATDLLESRLRLAKKFGATWVEIVPGPKPKDRSPKRKTLDFGLRTLDAAVLAVPSDAALEQAFQRVRGAGQILLFAHTKRPTPGGAAIPPASSASSGRGAPPMSLNPSHANVPTANSDSPRQAAHPIADGLFPLDLSRVCVDEKDLLGSYSADFTLQREVAKLVFSRKLNVRSLITHRFPLAQTPEAVNLASKPTPDSLKIIICP